MKRLGLLFEAIVDRQNLALAFLKALRGKRRSADALVFCRAVDANLATVRERFLALDPEWGPYRSFVISDPKERVISAAPFADRVMHHAVMNILEPLFERQSIFHSYACRKGKGTHAAVLRAFGNTKAWPWFLKLDVRKYFDSVDHRVLECQIGRLIKDGRVLRLLQPLIDSYQTLPGKGLPIGNLTSQFFANLYLSRLDHFILEQLRPAAYVRYMDDFVLWARGEEVVLSALSGICDFCADNLSLALKPPVLAASAQGPYETAGQDYWTVFGCGRDLRRQGRRTSHRGQRRGPACADSAFPGKAMAWERLRARTGSNGAAAGTTISGSVLRAPEPRGLHCASAEPAGFPRPLRTRTILVYSRPRIPSVTALPVANAKAGR